MKNLMFLAAGAKPMKPEREPFTGLTRKSWMSPFLGPLILLTGSFLFSGGITFGNTFPTAGPTVGGDDFNSATLNPYVNNNPIPVSTIASDPPGQCAWINTGLGAFEAANPPVGSGPSASGQDWTFNWAGAAAEAQVEAGISILDYIPYVVTKPSVTAGNGQVFPAGAPGELGGAVLNLKYTPQPGAPAITNLHWIQAYTGTLRGEAVPTLLDNDPGHPYTAQSGVTPFYDTAGYAAGTLPGGGGWFLDRPLTLEKEFESDPVASIQFQVVLANDAVSDVDGVVDNTVTLYGGEWWGFTYSAVDVPEPSAYLLLTLGGSGLLFFRSMAGRKRAALN